MSAAVRPSTAGAWWCDASREHFTAACIEYFGVGFSTDRSIVRSLNVPVTSQRKGVQTPNYTEDWHGNGGHKGARTRHAQRRIARGKALL